MLRNLYHLQYTQVPIFHLRSIESDSLPTEQESNLLIDSRNFVCFRHLFGYNTQDLAHPASSCSSSQKRLCRIYFLRPSSLLQRCFFAPPQNRIVFDLSPADLRPDEEVLVEWVHRFMFCNSSELSDKTKKRKE